MRAWLVVVGLVVGCKGASPPPAPGPTTPEPVPAQTCATDDDCMVSCAAKGNCCPDPYCETVQARSTVLQVTTYNDAHPCTDKAVCPQGGNRNSDDYSIIPRCKGGACVGEKTPFVAAPTMTQVIELSRYDHACKKDADCTVVQASVCAVCGCAAQPIAAVELPRFKADAAKIVCGERDDGIRCGDCAQAKPVCQAGMCIARF